MNIEECEKKDGKYFLLECKNRLSEFELVIKNEKIKIYKIQIKPFKKALINEKDFDLICDLYEVNDWEKENE